MAPPYILAVMGITGTGKSHFVRLVTADPNIKIGHSVTSGKNLWCAISVNPLKKIETTEITGYKVRIQGRDFVLVDTPGFDDTYRNDADVLRALVDWLAQNYREGEKLSGILYLHRMTDAKMTGSGLRNLRMVKQLCGEGWIKNLILGTTCWSLVSTSVAVGREAELKATDGFWGSMLSQGARSVRIPDTETDARKLVYDIAVRDGTALHVQRAIVDQGTKFEDLEVTKTVNLELQELRKEKEAEKLRDLQSHHDRQAQVDREARREREEIYVIRTRYCARKSPHGKCDRCQSRLWQWAVIYHCCSCRTQDDYWQCGPCGNNCGNDEHPYMSKIKDDCIVM